MDRYQFENSILEYLDNTLTIGKRKNFEDYIANNPDAKAKVESIRRLNVQMKHLPIIKTSTKFMNGLQHKIAAKKSDSEIQLPLQAQDRRRFLGFTPMVSGLMVITIIALVFVGIQLFPVSPANQGLNPSAGFSDTQPPAANTGTIGPVLNSSKDDFLAESEDDSMKSDEVRDKDPYSLEDKIQYVKNPQ